MLALLLTLACCGPAADDSWPQFEGPRRDNKSTDTGLAKSWPEGGPKLLWRAEGIGEGFSSVVIGQGRIYTAGNLGDATVITALGMDGQRVWQAPNGPAYTRQVPGSRGTPTLDGPRLYHLNGDGDLICLDSQSGRAAWSLSLIKQFDGRRPIWGCAESVLVDGDRLIACPGGEKIAMVALDKHTGATVWQCVGAGDPPSYASPILVDYGGLRQVVTMTAKSAIGVAAQTGKFLWRYERETPYDVNASSPVYHDGHVAIFTTWGRGTTLLRLNVSGQQCGVEKVWHTPTMDIEHGGVVLAGGYVYALADGNHRKRQWSCLEWKTGKLMYQEPGFRGSCATLTHADGMLFLVGDRGEVSLQRVNPRQFEVAGRFTLPKGVKGPVWARPVVCGGRLYLRHGEFLYAYGVRSTEY